MTFGSLYHKVILATRCLFGLSGCGYRWGNLHQKDNLTIAIPVWENETFWRDAEDELTNALKNASWDKTHFRLVTPMNTFETENPEADLRLTGRILSISAPVTQEGYHSSEPEEISVNISVEYELWRKKKDGDGYESCLKKTMSSSGRAFTRRGESKELAKRQALEKAARDIIDSLEADF